MLHVEDNEIRAASRRDREQTGREELERHRADRRRRRTAASGAPDWAAPPHPVIARELRRDRRRQGLCRLRRAGASVSGSSGTPSRLRSSAVRLRLDLAGQQNLAAAVRAAATPSPSPRGAVTSASKSVARKRRGIERRCVIMLLTSRQAVELFGMAAAARRSASRPGSRRMIERPEPLWPAEGKDRAGRLRVECRRIGRRTAAPVHDHARLAASRRGCARPGSYLRRRSMSRCRG